MTHPRLWILALLAALLLGCASSKAPAREFELEGEVIRLNAQARIATIRHGEIRGWMEAMTMDFPVREGEDLANLKPGSHIHATVFVEEPLFSIGNVRVDP
jgi:protein SCO1/2